MGLIILVPLDLCWCCAVVRSFRVTVRRCVSVTAAIKSQLSCPVLHTLVSCPKSSTVRLRVVDVWLNYGNSSQSAKFGEFG